MIGEAEGQKGQAESPETTAARAGEQGCKEKGKQTEGETIPIVIPVYGNLGYLANCLKAIQDNTQGAPGYYVILVDDCSPAGEKPSHVWLGELLNAGHLSLPFTDTISIRRHERNSGYTQAVNTGIRYALERRHESPWSFLVLLNTDTLPQQGWLNALQETVSQAANVGVVGAKLLSFDNPDQIIHGGTMDLLGTHKGGSERSGDCGKRTDETWVTGAVMAITYDCLVECGLLDRGWRHFCSDSGYCLEARLRGFRVIYQPKCRVLHKQSATVSKVVDMPQLQRDQQRLLDKVGGKLYRDLIAEMPWGISRILQQG